MSRELTITITDRAVRVCGNVRAKACDRRIALESNATAIPAGELANSILALLDELQIDGMDATLRIPASWCYLHALTPPSRRPSREMLRFALEEFVPVDIETLSCDFLLLADGGWLGVGTETTRLRGLVDGLLGRVAIQHIWPQLPAVVESGVSIWRDEHHIIITEWVKGQLRSARVHRFVQSGELNEPSSANLTSESDGPITVAGCASDEHLTALAAALGGVLVAAHLLVKNSHPAILEFARNELAPLTRSVRRWQALRTLAVTAIASATIVSVALFVQNRHLNSELTRLASWERSLYASVFPGQPAPGGIGLQLASERRRLEGLGIRPEIDVRDGLEQLLQICRAIPEECRYQFDEIRVDGREITLHGATRDHTHAEQLVAAITASAKLKADAPRTDRRPDGFVNFFVHAVSASPKPSRELRQ